MPRRTKRKKQTKQKEVPEKYKTLSKDSQSKKQYKNVIEEYTRLAKIYEERWKNYLASTEDAILSQLKLKGKETIVDAGCGTGSLICKIQEKLKHKGKLIGFDITPAMLDLAELKVTERRFSKNLQFELAHCEHFTAKNKSVDIVISSSVFHHLPHPEKALEEFHRVLKKNGRLLLLDLCTDFPSMKVYDFVARVFHKAHHKAYSSAEMQTLLKQHKFKVVSFKKWKPTQLHFFGVMLFEARKR